MLFSYELTVMTSLAPSKANAALLPISPAASSRPPRPDDTAADADEDPIPVYPQGIGLIASDSGSWRGPWRAVSPSNLAIGYPSGHEGNAEDPFFYRSQRGCES